MFFFNHWRTVYDIRVPCDGCLGLKADPFSIPFSNDRDVSNDKWLLVDSSGYDEATVKYNEISGR